MKVFDQAPTGSEAASAAIDRVFGDESGGDGASEGALDVEEARNQLVDEAVRRGYSKHFGLDSSTIDGFLGRGWERVISKEIRERAGDMGAGELGAFAEGYVKAKIHEDTTPWYNERITVDGFVQKWKHQRIGGGPLGGLTNEIVSRTPGAAANPFLVAGGSMKSPVPAPAPAGARGGSALPPRGIQVGEGGAAVLSPAAEMSIAWSATIADARAIIMGMVAAMNGDPGSRGEDPTPGRPDAGASDQASEPFHILNRSHSNSLPKPKGRGPNGGRLQSHHPLQNEWAANNLPGYSKGKAPSITLETGVNMPHTKLSRLQNARRNARVAAGKGKWSSSLQDELRYIVADLRSVGFSDRTIRMVMNQTYRMLDKLSVAYKRVEF